MRGHHVGAINLSRVFGVEKVVTADVRFSLRDLSGGRILRPLHPQKKTRRQIYVQASRAALGKRFGDAPRQPSTDLWFFNALNLDLISGLKDAAE